MNRSVNELIIICYLNSEIVKSWFMTIQVGMIDITEAEHAAYNGMQICY
jgi:hypothetical protein